MSATIRVRDFAGEFAEDKDAAREVRVKHLMPALRGGGIVTIDFAGVSSVTQSFVHAMVSAVIRKSNGETLDKIRFKNCNAPVRKVISIVAEYSQG